MAKNVAETASHNVSTRGTTFRHRIFSSFSPYPSHLALPFLVLISPCAVSLLYEDDWGRVSFRRDVLMFPIPDISQCVNNYFETVKS